jgi:glycosyltransferase 2 family protein
LSADEAETRTPGRRWANGLLRVAGLALLVYVLCFRVDWRDSVVLRDGSETGRRVVGAIVGDVPRRWDADAHVTLRTADGAEQAYGVAEIQPDPGTHVPDVNEGIVRIVRRSDKALLLVGLLVYGLITQIGVLRWWLLLRAQDVHVPFALARRLTFVGFFFNNVVPGPTGGDLVKAVYIARRTERRAEAVVTVVVDRVVGIVALALIAACVLVFRLDDPQYRQLAKFIGLFLGGVAAASVLFFSRRVRSFLRVERWSGRLPGGGIIRRADEAIFRWRSHKRAVVVALLLSFANQLCIQGLMLLFAAGLHVTRSDGTALPWTAYMAVLPVAFIVSALPVLPGGWGIRELAFAVCFAQVGVERNPAIALSVLNGVTQTLWSLVGGVYFLVDRGGDRAEASGSRL